MKHFCEEVNSAFAHSFLEARYVIPHLAEHHHVGFCRQNLQLVQKELDEVGPTPTKECACLLA